MKSNLFRIALGAALTIASSLALADRDRYRDDDRHGGHSYRGDYRVEEPHRWGHSNWRHSHRHHRPHWRHHWKHHVHDRWCGHQVEPPRYGPRRSGGHGYYDDGSPRITLIFSTDLH